MITALVFVTTDLDSIQRYLIGLEYYVPVNTIKVTSSWSFYLTTILLGRLSPLSSQPVLEHILSPETDNCLS